MQEVFLLESYHIRGGTPLHGEYPVKGAKNAALPILAAALCKGGIHEIYGCPDIGDASVMMDILKGLGADCRRDGNCLVVDSRQLTSAAVPRQLMSMLRSSVFLMGSLLMRTGEAVVYRPGGCNIGSRPIDIHTDGLRHLGYTVTEDEEKIVCSGRCRGGRYVLPYPSVGATENLMMAALSGDRLTVLENCAIEPEILDLQGFLRTCGFQVYGAGTGTIAVLGGKGISDAMYFIMEDRIEAATYLMALAGTGGRNPYRCPRQTSGIGAAGSGEYGLPHPQFPGPDRTGLAGAAQKPGNGFDSTLSRFSYRLPATADDAGCLCRRRDTDL